MDHGDMIEHHQDKYMMSLNYRQQVLVPRGRAVASSGIDQYYESWEERAFAEDAARGLGGFIWPPRSYTCSFCRREFKSAQALGGHMNVHRRDRARLKLALSPRSSETNLLDQQQEHADSVILQQSTITFPASTEDKSPYDDSGDHHARKKSIGVWETENEDKELHVSTKLCMGLSLDEVVSAANSKCKRLKSGNIILVDPCLVVQSATPLLHHEGHHDLGGVKMRLMEELDLELRLGV